MAGLKRVPIAACATFAELERRAERAQALWFRELRKAHEIFALARQTQIDLAEQRLVRVASKR